MTDLCLIALQLLEPVGKRGLHLGEEREPFAFPSVAATWIAMERCRDFVFAQFGKVGHAVCEWWHHTVVLSHEDDGGWCAFVYLVHVGIFGDEFSVFHLIAEEIH